MNRSVQFNSLERVEYWKRFEFRRPVFLRGNFFSLFYMLTGFRWTYDEFAKRYRVLFAEGKNLWRKNSKQFANLACLKWLDKEKFALGTTKIFLRTGQVALIERIRHQILNNSAILIQKIWRGFVKRRSYLFIQQALLIIQVKILTI